MGERLIKYEICGNLFTQKGSLDAHWHMRSGEKHFVVINTSPVPVI